MQGIPIQVNGEECSKGKLIANPNCTTAIALMALYPLHKEFTVKHMIMSTYQVRGVRKFSVMKVTSSTLKIKFAESDWISQMLPNMYSLILRITYLYCQWHGPMTLRTI